jgi:hypothetical protein
MTVTLHMERPTSIPLVFTRAVWNAMFRRQGDVSAEALEAIPEIEVLMPSVTPDPARLSAFLDICACGDSDNLPVAFPETLFLTLMARIVTSEHFPLSPLGLIHMSQTIESLEPIDPTSPLDLRCSLAGRRKTKKGVEIDCALEVTASSTLAWKGTTTFLSRSKKTRSRKKSSKQRSTPPEPESTFTLPANTGRRFAAASSDYNPHHLTVLTARLIGYRRPIAHGMWTLSRCLSELESDHDLSTFTIRADFKKPIYLPGKVGFSRIAPSGGSMVTFGVHDLETGAPHLLGSLVPR